MIEIAEALGPEGFGVYEIDWSVAPPKFALGLHDPYMCAISASPNCEHFTSLAPSIKRAKS